jgi:membrane protease YdiL (CAAX protease family)
LRKESRNALIAFGVFILSIVLITILDGLIVLYYAAATGLSLESATIATTRGVLVANELLFAILALLFFTKIFKRRLVELGLTTLKFGRNIMLGIAVGIGGWFIAVLIALILEMLIPYEVPEWFTRMLTPTSALDLAYFMILTWVLIGPCEELFFRGFIQGTFTAWKGPVAGLIAGSILFGLAHFDPTLWFRTIPTALLGLIYGVLYARRKSIIPVAVAHSITDTIGFVLAYLAL